MANKKLWGGRFKKPLNVDAVSLSYSLQSDKRLVYYDINVNKAHALALHKSGYLSESEFTTLDNALQQLAEDFQNNPDSLYANDEDIHSCIERLITQRCGDLGKKMHTGKSRNDQVITDTRLFTKDAIIRIKKELQQLISTLVLLADKYHDVMFPGFTHFQPAQPVLFSHHLLAFCEQFFRDLTRFEFAFESADVCALGSGAMAGNNYNLDRSLMAKTLGFSRISTNSMDAVSDRDFICDVLSACSVCMTHLSRFCEEIVTFSSPLVGFFQLGDDFTTGSSLMPQKKNPDIAELIRGKTGRVHGHWVALQTTLKGLPLTYNRDLQEDKVFLFDAVDTLELSLKCFHQMLNTLQLNKDAILDGLHKGYGVATDFADYLVSIGIAFRDAHELTGEVVIYAIENNKQLHELSLEEFQKFHADIQPNVYEYITYEAAVNAKTIQGGTAPQAVSEQLKKVKEKITWKNH